MASSRTANVLVGATPRVVRNLVCAFLPAFVLTLALVGLIGHASLRVARAQEDPQGSKTSQTDEKNEKPEVPTPTKRVAAGSQAAGTSQSSNVCAGAGDVVSYCLEAALPKDLGNFASYKLWFCDELDDGLEYVPSSVRSYVRHRDGTTANVPLEVSIAQNTMRVGSNDVLQAVPDLVPGDVLVVEYDCIVGLGASCGLVQGNQNTLRLQYSRTATTEEQSVSKVASVYSLAIDLHKVGESGGEDLAGACFVVQNEEGQYRALDGAWTAGKDDAQVVTTDKSGIASFGALGEGTYTLTETTAPQGYELLEGPIEVTLAASDLDGSQRTLTATVAGSGATVEAVDGTTGVATVAVEDPKSKEPLNPDDTTSTPSGNKTTASTNKTNGSNKTTSSGTSSAGTGTTRTQLATTADPSFAVGVGSLAVAAVSVALVVAGVALRQQDASICGAWRGFTAQDGNGRWRGRQSHWYGRTNK